MKQLIAIVSIGLVAGCMSSSAPEPRRWLIAHPEGEAVQLKDSPGYGTARVLAVLVRAPYNDEAMSVLKADGTFASDRYNEFASSPTQLLKGLVYDAMTRSGLFADVVSATSSAKSDVSAEVLVTRFALDCRDASAERMARVELTVRLIDDDGRTLKTALGAGGASAKDGDYGVAFSQASLAALNEALGQLKK